MSINSELSLTLEEAVAEVLGQLTGLELTYQPEYDRFRAVTRQLNRAMRSCALEKEWSYYSDTANLGAVGGGTQQVDLPADLRMRVINDDAVRLVRSEDEAPLRWAYILPRDALHKYRWQSGLWASYTRSTLIFSRPLSDAEGALDVLVPVMREPVMFRLPQPDTPEEENPEVPDSILQQEIDFPYPDLVVLRAAYFYAQSDPVMQPRVQTLEAQYKDLMYQIIERDDRATDLPEMNTFLLPIQNSLAGSPGDSYHHHPLADNGR